MTKQDDVEALLGAVRDLVSSRMEGKDPLLLTADQRVEFEEIGPQPASDDAGRGLSSGDRVLRDFARLSLISPVEPGDNDPDEPDLAALRDLIREIFREEVRSRMGPRINKNIRRIIEKELGQRANP